MFFQKNNNPGLTRGDIHIHIFTFSAHIIVICVIIVTYSVVL